MNWEALGGDPVPGDLAVVRTAARALGDVGRRAEDVRSLLLGVDDGSGAQVWRGEAATAFRELLAGLDPDLATLAQAYHRADQALVRYAGGLEQAQVDARRAAMCAQAAVADRATARSRQDRAADEARAERSMVHQAQSRADLARTLRASVPDPAQGAQSCDEEDRAVDGRRQAEDRESRARSREDAARNEADEAGARLEAARRIAGQAEQLRDQAARVAVEALDDAGRAGIAHHNVFQRFWKKAGDLTREFTSRPEFASFLNVVSGAGDVLALMSTVCSVVPMLQPVAATLLVFAVGLKGVAFLGTALAAYHGNASTSQVLGRGIDVALAAVPLRGVLQSARGVRSAEGAQYLRKIKRAIFYDDMGKATFWRGFRGARKLTVRERGFAAHLNVSPKTYFRTVTVAEGVILVHNAAEGFRAAGNRLWVDITHFDHPQARDGLGDVLSNAATAGVKPLVENSSKTLGGAAGPLNSIITARTTELYKEVTDR